MNILVTGGAGYIGSHTCVELLNNNHNVIVVDNLSNSKKEAINRVEAITNKKVKFYEIDILDKRGLDLVFKSNTIDAVIHFAGLKAVGESVEEPLKYYQNNITGTLVLMDIMKRHNVKKIVFSSSATVYGMNNVSPLTEELPLSTTNPYGTTKMYIERIIRDTYQADNEWSGTLLRYFNPIGAHHSGTIGEDPKGVPNNLMPFITQVAVGKREKLSVFGNDYDTHDGTGVRDYIHVVDLAKGHLKALEFTMKNKTIEAINLGTGVGYSVLDMVDTFRVATNTKVPYQIIDRRPGDIATCFADTKKAKELLDWETEKNLADMCRDSWRWQSDNPEGY
ncbi:MAG: UDP-glucose 4-epimerase GalE [Clostridiales bacterium]|nr:UDP-glucose 4-epimerase GalE [Clostridiales bacterium]